MASLILWSFGINWNIYVHQLRNYLCRISKIGHDLEFLEYQQSCLLTSRFVFGYMMYHESLHTQKPKKTLAAADIAGKDSHL